MLARCTFASQHFENVDSLPHFAFAGSSGRDAEKICQAYEFSSLRSRRQRRRPTEQQRNAARRFKEVLFLPAVMVAEQIAMVRKKADENIPGVWSRFYCVENPPETIIQVSDLAVVTRLHCLSQRGVNCVRPNGVTHERNFFVQVIFFHVAEDRFRQSIGIVHPIERNRRSQWGMRPNKRNKSKERARIIAVCDFLDCAISRPPFAA